MRSSLFVAFFALAALGPIALIACSNSEDDGSDQASEDEIKKKKAGLEGQACNDTKKCATGLLCKQQSSGPPPGAVGLPAPTSTGRSSGGPPPGAVGLPAPPKDGTCQKPAPGEEGGTCTEHAPCNPGLDCVYTSNNGTSTSGGPPPGAVGLPQPPSTSTGRSSGGPPPGAVGLPIPQQGTCKPSGGSSTSGSGGPPPGAVGLPMPPHT